LDAGAETLVLVNTVLGMAIDVKRRTYRLGSGPGGGGLSGPAIRPVAVRAVHDCRVAYPSVGIVGVGGISRGVDAVEMMLAGADAVEVGTATFRDPRAPARVLAGLQRWCRLHDVGDVRRLVGAVQGPPVAIAPADHVPARGRVAPTPPASPWAAPSSAPPAAVPPPPPSPPPPPPPPPAPPPPPPPAGAGRPRPGPVTRPEVSSRLPQVPAVPPRRGPGTPGGDRG
jgi:hypothetical protein